MESTVRKPELSKEAQSAFATFTQRIDSEIDRLNKALDELEKTKTEFEAELYAQYDPLKGPPWWISDPAKFKGMLLKLDSSTALIIDLLIEIETAKSLKPIHEELPVAQTVAPHVQVNVPAVGPASEEKTGKGYGLWSFLHDIVYRPKPQPDGGPSRVIEEKEVFSIIENLRQIPALLNKLDDWYGPTLLERTLVAPNPDGYLIDNEELSTFMSKILRIVSTAIPAARRQKERLLRFETQVARTYIEASAAERKYVPIGAEDLRRA